MTPADVDQYLQGRQGKVGLSSQVAHFHELRTIFPSVGYPCKFRSYQILNKIPAKLYSKETQSNSASQVDPAEKCSGDEFASPGNERCHDKAPEHGAS